MEELSQIFLTASLTIVGGVIIYVLGEVIRIVFINPLQEFNGVIARIDNKLKFYSNVITSPFNREDLRDRDVLDRVRYISKTIRSLSCELEVSFRQLNFCFKSKNRELAISRAASLLIGLSNSLVGPNVNPLDNSKNIDEVRKLLSIPSLST